MDVKVSVILPSLNVVDYIEECLNSVTRQTLQDIEIICIDAGSSDGTLDIIQKYAKKDKRIQVVHSNIRSYGYQINLGIDIARGEYLGIVETDDYIEFDMYKELYHVAKKNDLDFVKSGFDVFVTPTENERYLLKYPMSDFDQIISSEYFMYKELSNDIYIWNGIYKQSFLKKHNVRLNESPGAAFQDCGFRYLVDMNLHRGMFLEQSFYRYRRDNRGSSTYNSNCVKYNLEECKYLRKRMEEDRVTDKKKYSFIARETVMMALEPYSTLRGCCEPDQETLEALDEFREIIRKDRKDGFLSQENMLPKHWVEMRLFTENPEVFEIYLTVSSEARYGLYKNFIKKMSEKEQIVIFGAGKSASYALCLMRMNGIKHIQAFCDNNSDKWGSRYMGYEVLSPEEAAMKYPEAHYLIANIAHGSKIREQLYSMGFAEESVSLYKLPLSPIESTNYFMKLYG